MPTTRFTELVRCTISIQHCGHGPRLAIATAYHTAVRAGNGLGGPSQPALHRRARKNDRSVFVLPRTSDDDLCARSRF